MAQLIKCLLCSVSLRTRDWIPRTWVKSKAGVALLEAEITQDKEASWLARLVESVSSGFNSQALSIKEAVTKEDIQHQLQASTHIYPH